MSPSDWDVVREAMEGEWFSEDVDTALDRLEAENVRLLARAEKAEAERDEFALEGARLIADLRSAEQRVAELEAALQGITEAAQAYVRDPSPETWLAGINAARAALGGGEA